MGPRIPQELDIAGPLVLDTTCPLSPSNITSQAPSQACVFVVTAVLMHMAVCSSITSHALSITSHITSHTLSITSHITSHALSITSHALSSATGVCVRGDGGAAAHGRGAHRKLPLPPARPRPHPGLLFFITLKPRVKVVQQSKSLKYEPASEPMHISVKLTPRSVSERRGNNLNGCKTLLPENGSSDVPGDRGYFPNPQPLILEPAAERKGNSLQCFDDIYLTDQASIWPGLSCVCHTRSTAVGIRA